MTDGKTRVCGIIANPVEHSMSPLLQNLYAKRTGVNLTYVPFKVKEEEVENAVRGAYSLNILGLNVTVPHKQSVMEYLEEIDGTAAAIGAVNTLVRTENGYKGYNTDVPGLLRVMEEEGFDLKGRECILIGAGGAAKAAAYLMLKEKVAKIYLLNRNVARAAALAAELNKEGGQVIPLPLNEYGKIPKGRYFAIQSTSVGMHPNIDAAPIEDPAFYENISEAVDMIYTPAKTKFMKYVEKAGGRSVNGLNMLLYQGVISYELWNPGVKVGRETIDEARGKIETLLTGKKPVKMEQDTRKMVFIGFMGAGKTSLGAAYAEKHSLPLVDLDDRIEEKAGMSVSDIFEKLGEETFRQMETQALRDMAEEPGPMMLSVGGGLPLREENRKLLKELGTVIHLRVSPDTVLERLKGDTTRPLLQGGDVRRKVEDLMKKRNPIYEDASHHSVIVDGKDIVQIVEEIESVLK